MCKNQYYNCIVCKCPSVGSRGCQGCPLWGDSADAAPCQTHSALASAKRPTTGYDWAQQPRHWCPGENVFIKDRKNTIQTERGGKTESEKRQMEHQSQKKRKRSSTAPKQISALQSAEDWSPGLCWSKKVFSKGLQCMESPWWSKGNA